MTSNTIHDKFIVYDVIAKLLVKEIQKWSESNKLADETINDKRLELFRFVLTTDFDMQMGRLNESDYVSIIGMTRKHRILYPEFVKFIHDFPANGLSIFGLSSIKQPYAEIYGVFRFFKNRCLY